MANTSYINGFLPVKKTGGGTVEAIGPYPVTTETEINVGDVVTLVDQGSTTSLDVYTATTTVGNIGIAASYAAATDTAAEIMVWPGMPDVIFQCQQGASGGAGLVALGGIGKCADAVVATGIQESGAYGTVGQSRSGHYLNDTVSNDGLFHIVQLAQIPDANGDDNAYGSNSKVWVTFNEGAWIGTADGIADV